MFLFTLTSIFLVACLAISIPYLLNLQNCLKAISPQNRRLEPGLVWLMYIPVFNLVWQFIVVLRMSQSIESEYMMRGVPTLLKPTQGVGLVMCILSLAGFIPFLGTFAWLAAIICFIIYWARIAEHRNRIRELPPYSGDVSSIFY